MPGKIVHGCAYALPGVAKGKAWVISPEFLLSNFKFQAVNGYKILDDFTIAKIEIHLT